MKATAKRKSSEAIFLQYVEKIYGTEVRALRGAEAEEVAKEVLGRIGKDYKDSPNFHGSPRHFRYNPELNDGEGGIEGSSTYLGIVINECLPNDLWLPDLRTGRKLGKKGKLSNGVYRDYGLVVFSGKGRNEEIAKVLAPELKRRKYKLPVIASFSDLELDKKGLEIRLKKEASGLISGEEAIEELNNLNYKGDSGVQRLIRDLDGDWGAYWNDLPDSYAGGRVDSVCAKGARENSEDVLFLEDKGELLRTLEGVRNGSLRNAELDKYIDSIRKQ